MESNNNNNRECEYKILNGNYWLSFIENKKGQKILLVPKVYPLSAIDP